MSLHHQRKTAIARPHVAEASIQYRPEIDGLRTIAVVPVILFHAGLSTLSGGFVGVDIFFVISGYLITSILVRDLDAGTFSILHFYERRARRILPAIFLVTFCSIPFALWLLLPRHLSEYFASVAGVATFSSNFIFYLQDDYFGTSANMKPLLHTWSLAVEEQYYIFFPPLLALIWRWGRRALVPFILIVFAISLAVAEIVLRFDAPAAFYMLPTRAWELAIGGLAALVMLAGRWSPSRLHAQLGSLVGLALIFLSLVVIDEASPFPGLAALLPTLGTVLVVLFALEGTLACRILSLPLMVGIGLISYSAYLWHQPLFVFARHYYLLDTPTIVILGLIALTFLLAYCSWRFVEAPFRARGLISRKAIFAMSGMGMAALFAIAYFGHANAPALASTALSRVPTMLDYRYDNRALRSESWAPLRELTGSPHYKVDGNPEDHKLWFNPEDPRSKILLIGNSHSKDFYNILTSSKSMVKQYQLARFGTQVDEFGDKGLNSPNYQESDIIIVTSLYGPDDLAAFQSLVRRFINDGKKLVIIKNVFQFPEFKYDTLTRADELIIMHHEAGSRSDASLADTINKAYYVDFVTGAYKANAKAANAAISRIAIKYPSVTVLDRMDLYCDKDAQQCFASDDRLNKFFYDGGHLTIAGARHFGRRMDETGWLVSDLKQ